MNKLILTLFTVLIFFASGIPLSYGFCGGNSVKDTYCDQNDNDMITSCCPDGQIMIGIAYENGNASDGTTNMSAVCYDKETEQKTVLGSFAKEPFVFICDLIHETFAGIACKRTNKDKILDGCTAICLSSETGSFKPIFNSDLEGDGNQDPYNTKVVQPPYVPTGIGFKHGNVTVEGDEEKIFDKYTYYENKEPDEKEIPEIDCAIPNEVRK